VNLSALSNLLCTNLPYSTFSISYYFFFFNYTTTTEIYTLSLHDALPIWRFKIVVIDIQITLKQMLRDFIGIRVNRDTNKIPKHLDRKSGSAGMPRPISYAVFCLKKKKYIQNKQQSHLPYRQRSHNLFRRC